METTPLSDADLDLLAAQVDDQLKALRALPQTTVRGLEASPGDSALPDAPAQREIVAKAAGEPFESFWQKYRRHLRKDLCLPGGMLHEQWRKYKDLESKSAVRVSYAWLAAMGLPTASLAPAAVAVSVFLLNVVLKIGIDVICEDCAQEEKAGEAAPDKAPKAKPASPKRKTDQ